MVTYASEAGPKQESAWTAALCAQAYDGEPGSTIGWHGPSINKIINDIGWEEASRRLTPSAHTIWELVLHIAVWDEICVQRLSGDEIHATTGSPGDWPEVPAPTAGNWDASKSRLAAAQRALTAKISSLNDADFERKVAGWPWDYRLMIHGTLHHDLYHAGQIALLKTALRNS